MKKNVFNRAAFFAVLIFASVFTSCGKKSANPLWDELAKLKSDYNWVDLSFDVSPQTVHWWGFDPLVVAPKYTFEGTFNDFGNIKSNSFAAFLYTLPGQYGTHTDFPGHFDPAGRKMDTYGVKDFVYPLVVIDKSGAVASNYDYALSKQDILDWEKQHGNIPAGSFAAFRSDWSKRSAAEYEAPDADGNSHYPGWDIEALKYLIDERNVAVVGHETPDTDPAIVGNSEAGMIGEDYVLDHGRLNVELLRNLDKLPPSGAIVFITFPNVKDGVGFTSRVFAIAPK
ncbi:metal-dependent hydrolase [Spirochaetia bacterium]|nr:metal-dependent hydrolase [Spirochaetia bacterium]